MTRRDHHTANRVQVFDRVGHRRCRRRARRQDDLETVAGEHLRRALPKRVGEEPPVVADDDLSFCARYRIGGPVVGRRLRDAFDISEGKLFSDDGPPAVRPELDAHSLCQLHPHLAVQGKHKGGHS